MKVTLHFDQSIISAREEARRRGDFVENFDIQAEFIKVSEGVGDLPWEAPHAEKRVICNYWRVAEPVCYLAAVAYVPRQDATVLAMDVPEGLAPGIEAFPPPQSKEFVRTHIAALLDRNNVLWCSTGRGTPAVIASLLCGLQNELGLDTAKVSFRKPLCRNVERLLVEHGVTAIDAKLAVSLAAVEEAHRGGLNAISKLLFKPRHEGEQGDLKASVHLEVGRKGFSAVGGSDIIAEEIARELVEEYPDGTTFVLGNGDKIRASNLGRTKQVNVAERGDTFEMNEVFARLADWRDELLQDEEIAL